MGAGEAVFDVDLPEPGGLTGGAFGGETLGHLGAEGSDGVCAEGCVVRPIVG